MKANKTRLGAAPGFWPAMRCARVVGEAGGAGRVGRLISCICRQDMYLYM